MVLLASPRLTHTHRSQSPELENNGDSLLRGVCETSVNHSYRQKTHRDSTGDTHHISHTGSITHTGGGRGRPSPTRVHGNPGRNGQHTTC